MKERIRVRVYDFRHYSRDKAAYPEFQLPTMQGRWEMAQLIAILIEMGIDPDAIVASPQQRGWLMAELVARGCNWSNAELVERFEEFNDIKSDPTAAEQGIVKSVKEFCKSYATRISTEAALLLDPKSRNYMWDRSGAYISGLEEAIAETDGGECVALFSHGGQVEMRFLRLRLLANGTPLADQTLDMINIADLDEFGGMLRTGEGFTYDLLIEGNGTIVGVENLGSIRLPQVPPEIAVEDD